MTKFHRFHVLQFPSKHFHLTYNTKKKTKVCFYINKRLNTNKLSVLFSSIDIITLKLKVTKNEIKKEM